MGCLGVHFALTKSEVDALRSIPNQRDRVSHLREEIEEEFFGQRKDHLAENDKAWDAMHRALSDGRLTWDGGKYPLNHVILGGKLLYTNNDFIMSLKAPQQVRDVSEAITSLTEADFHRRYFDIDPVSYGMRLTEEDFRYTWDWFQQVRKLFKRAADEKLYVLFTASQ